MWVARAQGGYDHGADHGDLSLAVWAGGNSQAGLQRMRKVDQVPCQRSLLVSQTMSLSIPPGSL